MMYYFENIHDLAIEIIKQRACACNRIEAVPSKRRGVAETKSS